MERSRGLDGGTLKLLAAACMLLDHVGAILFPQTLWLQCVGRLAFPVFAFLVAEGYAHTRDLRKYLLRMAAFAALSELPFDWKSGSVWDLNRQNVLLTFCLALLTLRGIDALRRERGMARYMGTAAVAAAGFAVGQLLRVDYGGGGVLTVVLFYLCREGVYARPCLLAGMAALNCLCIGSIKTEWFGVLVPIQIWAVLSLPLIWLYNGHGGGKGRRRWAFYAFYPAHLLILEGIRALT